MSTPEVGENFKVIANFIFPSKNQKLYRKGRKGYVEDAKEPGYLRDLC